MSTCMLALFFVGETKTSEKAHNSPTVLIGIYKHRKLENQKPKLKEDKDKDER